MALSAFAGAPLAKVAAFATVLAHVATVVVLTVGTGGTGRDLAAAIVEDLATGARAGTIGVDLESRFAHFTDLFRRALSAVIHAVFAGRLVSVEPLGRGAVLLRLSVGVDGTNGIGVVIVGVLSFHALDPTIRVQFVKVVARIAL